MSNEEKEKEKDKSIYNYNMIFNKIGNDTSEDDIKFNIDLISDIDLRNFHPKRYEYYTSLLKIYNEDPDTLFNLLNKYNKIKYTKEDEKILIRQIYDYAVKYKNAKDREEREEREGNHPHTGGAPQSYDKDGKLMKTAKEIAKEAIAVEKLKENVIENIEQGTSKKRDQVQPSTEKNDNIENLIDYLIKKIDHADNPNEVGVSVTKYIRDKADDDMITRTSSSATDTSIIPQTNTQTKPTNTLIPPPTKPITPPPTKPITPPTKTPPTKPTAGKEIDEDKLLDEAIKLSLEFIKGNFHATEEAKSTIDSSLELMNDIIENNGTKSMVDNSLELIEDIISNSKLQQGGGKQNRKRGGASQNADEYEDDELKMRYLDTKRYNYVDNKKLDEYRDVQKKRKNNIAPIKTSNKIEQLSNDIDVYNIQIPKTIDDDKYIIQQIRNFENDPKNPIEELALTFDDRIVFIIATFFIRYITIIMVQWCIDINIIKTFYEGFIYYAIIYILIFWFIVLFVNIDNTYDVKYLNFNGVINSIRTLFYYFYMGTNGISRLLIHTSLILILIVIPIILNIKSKSEFKEDDQNEAVVILAYEERKKLSKSLSLFTMFIWLFTSIIATKF
jgi:soluble cytochrome b562